jgi:hypothetical protein
LTKFTHSHLINQNIATSKAVNVHIAYGVKNFFVWAFEKPKIVILLARLWIFTFFLSDEIRCHGGRKQRLVVVRRLLVMAVGDIRHFPAGIGNSGNGWIGFA